MLSFWIVNEGTFYPTNTPRVFHVETTWKRSFPRRFNVEYTWSVCRVLGYNRSHFVYTQNFEEHDCFRASRETIMKPKTKILGKKYFDKFDLEF